MVVRKAKIIGKYEGLSAKTGLPYVRVYLTYPMDGLDGLASDHTFIKPDKGSLYNVGDEVSIAYRRSSDGSYMPVILSES